MTAFEARTSQAGQIGKVGFPPGEVIRGPSRSTTALDPKQPVVAGENINRLRSRADDQVSVIRRKRPAGFGGRLLSWLMGMRIVLALASMILSMHSRFSIPHSQSQAIDPLSF